VLSEGLGEFDVDRPGTASTVPRTTTMVRRCRVRFHRGWASVRASDGDLLLVVDGPGGLPEPEPEPESFWGTLGLVSEASEATKMQAVRQAATERASVEQNSVTPEMAAIASSCSAESESTGERHRVVKLQRQLSLPRMSCSSSLLRLDVPRECPLRPRCTSWCSSPSYHVMLGLMLRLVLGGKHRYAALMELECALPPLLQAFDWSLKYRYDRSVRLADCSVSLARGSLALVNDV
jgi:hypothetical protein